MSNQLLLLKDVDDLGRSGDIVKVKPGYGRNFLIPKKFAVVADKFTLRMQTRLQEERSQRAAVDKSEAEKISARLEGLVLTVEVKVDPDGHMYGSVSANDVIRLLADQDVQLERRNVDLVQPIKDLGTHSVRLKLKEGVPALITVRVMSEAQLMQEQEEAFQPE